MADKIRFPDGFGWDMVYSDRDGMITRRKPSGLLYFSTVGSPPCGARAWICPIEAGFVFRRATSRREAARGDGIFSFDGRARGDEIRAGMNPRPHIRSPAGYSASIVVSIAWLIVPLE